MTPEEFENICCPECCNKDDIFVNYELPCMEKFYFRGEYHCGACGHDWTMKLHITLEREPQQQGVTYDRRVC